MRRCRLKAGWMVFFGLGVLLFASAAAGMWFLPHEARDEAILLPVVSSMFGFLAIAFACLLRMRVDFDEERLEVFTGFRGRSLARAHVVGRRMKIYKNGQRELLLLSDAPGEKPLQIPPYIALAPELAAWIAELPDRDLEELQAATQEIVAEYGMPQLARAQWIAKLLNFFAIGALLWAWFYPRPYPLAMAANIAAFALAFLLAVSSGGGYQLDKERTDPRPSLGAPLVMPGGILTMRMLMDLHFIGISTAIAPALCLGALMAAVLMLRDARERKRPWRFLLLMPLLSAFPFGAILYADAALDGAEPRTYAASILDKQVSPGKTTTWRLRVDAFGPRTEPAFEDVPRSTYDRVKRGDRLRVRLYPGRLGIPWFVIDPP